MKRGDAVTTRHGGHGVIRRIARDGSWADVAWLRPDGKERGRGRVPTEHLMPLNSTHSAAPKPLDASIEGMVLKLVIPPGVMNDPAKLAALLASLSPEFMQSAKDTMPPAVLASFVDGTHRYLYGCGPSLWPGCSSLS